MSNPDKKDDTGSLVIGGATLIGIGVGFIFFHISVFWFIAFTMIGIGVGLVTAAIISKE